MEKINTSIAKAQSKYPNLLEDDYLLEKVTNLFNGRIGGKYLSKRLEEIYKEFEQRFRLQIPPGYRDKNPKREGLKKYGDGVLWFQLIDYAKSHGKPIILMTDDQKDDWWRIDKGKTLGPRPELVEEIRSKASAAFYMYNASQFMIYAKEFLGFQVKQEAIDEVRDVGQQDKNYDVMSGNTDIFGYKQRVQELVDSPAHQMMRDYLSSPAHKMMLDYLSSTDFEKVRNAQLDKKNYWVVGDRRE
ncbi:MAG: PIN-like domain-containing protein [Ktedonobacteraceae bacterium]